MRNMFDFYDEMDSLLGFPKSTDTFPPYDVYKYEDGSAKVVVAVAGYKRDDLNIVMDGNILDIEGARRLEEDEDAICVHQGIAKRAFKLRFRFDDYLEPASAELFDGLLTVTWAVVNQERAAKTLPIK